MRLPVPGPRDVLSALERGTDQLEALVGAVPRVLALLDRAEVLVERAATAVDRVDGVVDAATVEVARVGTVVDAATVEVARVATVVDAAAREIERVSAVVGAAASEVGRVANVVDTAAVQVGRAGDLVDRLEPSLTRLQPTLETLADTTSPEEVASLVRLVDHLPALTEQVERDLLPVLATLSSVAPDLHDLLNVSRELNEILGKIPGVGRLKRKVEEDDDELPVA